MPRNRLFPLVALTAALPALLPSAIEAQPATLVHDFNQGNADAGDLNNIADMTGVPGRVFFSATDSSDDNREMWASDGTAEGTFPLKDACPGPCDSEPVLLGSLGGILFWAGRADDGKSYLWRSDGTRAGTFRLVEEPVRWNGDLLQTEQPISSVAGGHFYFVTSTADGDRLWRTDGTPAGTQVVRTLAAGQRIETLLTDAGKVFLLVVGPGSPWAVWKSDGTAAGTRSIAEVELPPQRPRVAGGRLFFLARTSGFGVDEVWASDGTAAGTRAVARFEPPAFVDDELFQVSGGRLFFKADDVVHGVELYQSDGTVAGTRRITDFGIDDPGFGRLANLGSRVVFTADDALGHSGVWTTAGNPAETRFLPLPCGPDCDDRIFDLIKVGPRAVLRLHNNLLSTDGTPAGTTFLRGCATGCAFPRNLPAEAAAVPFAAGNSLWITDGTAAGTRRRSTLPAGGDIDDFHYFEASAGSFTLVSAEYRNLTALWAFAPAGGAPRLVATATPNGPGHPALDNLAALGDRLAFTLFDSDTFALWTTVGSEASTAPAVPLDQPSDTCRGGVISGSMASLGPSVVYLNDDEELCGSDGTPAGTRQLTPEGLAVERPLAVGTGRVWFVARRDGLAAVWTSDGTPVGTRELAVPPAELGEEPRALTAVGNELFFLVGVNDTQLWRSDGTPQGTGKMADVGDTSVNPSFARVGSAVYFVARNAVSPVVWRSDGTAAGTRELGPVAGMDDDSYPSELTAFQGALYFFAWVERGVRGLWRSDGTAAGTVLLGRFRDVEHSSEPIRRQLTPAAGRLFFVADDGAGAGRELWATDGTPAGTRVALDIDPGVGSSRPDDFVAAGGRLFFTAAEATHGRELWVSDGTAAGTRLVHDIAPFSQSSQPTRLTAAGGRLYFFADDGVTGRELWTVPLAGPAGCQPSSTRLCLNGGRYQVEAFWRTGGIFFESQSGPGRAVPLSGDTGYFWFFDAANVEVVIKILDGRPLNGHVWVFYGALSNVDYTLTVTDTQTGLTRRYHNPPGRLASVGDTQGFGPLGAFSTTPVTVEPPASPPLALELVAERVDPAATSPCQAGPSTLCLNDNRFAVAVAWKDFQGNTGPGTAVALTADTGTFWFFDPANVELVVKVLDGRPLNGKFWLFYGALSNVEYTLTVTDTETGIIRTYRNPSGRFGSVADTGAF